MWFFGLNQFLIQFQLGTFVSHLGLESDFNIEKKIILVKYIEKSNWIC